MKKKNEILIAGLKKLIDNNGYDYIAEKPIEVYKKLVAQSGEKIMSGAIMMLLVTGMWDEVKCAHAEERPTLIQKKCGFNEKMATILSYIVETLYSDENKTEWREKQYGGLVHFLKNKHCFKWDGFAVWEISNGSVDYSYHANIEVKPTKKSRTKQGIKKIVRKKSIYDRRSNL